MKTDIPLIAHCSVNHHLGLRARSRTSLKSNADLETEGGQVDAHTLQNNLISDALASSEWMLSECVGENASCELQRVTPSHPLEMEVVGVGRGFEGAHLSS